MTTPIVVTRHRCEFCRRSFAKRSYAAKHEVACSWNPATRACNTCVHFDRTPCCAVLSDECGCKGLNDCAVGAFVTWRFNDHKTHAPDPEGWWTHVEDWRRGCEKWMACHVG